MPPSAGVVERVLVGLGQKVAAGDGLATIVSQQVSELRSEMAAAARRVELARTTFERERQLWKDGISAEQDYLQARQTLQEAEIALANARQKGKTISPQGEAGDGSRYNLRAPFSGVVVEKHLVPGEVVSETSNAFTVADLSRVWVTFSVSPRDLEQVKVGQSVRVSAPELGREATGKVAYISRLLGEQTRTATGRIDLDNADGIWRPGLFVSVALATESHEAAAVVPASSIQDVEDKTSVFVRTAEGFEVRPVTLGTRSDGFVEVREGLKSGERVAATGSFILKSNWAKAAPNTRTDPHRRVLFMFERIIQFAIEQRFLVLLAVWRWPVWAWPAIRSCRSTPFPTSPTSRYRSVPLPRAFRRWKPSSASLSRSKRPWPACRI